MATRSTREHNHHQGGCDTHNMVKPLVGKRGLTTRSRNGNDQNYDPIVTKTATNKRKADDSPLKNSKTSKLKRSALGNLTNAGVNYLTDTLANKLSKKTVLSNVNNTNQPKNSGPIGSGMLLPPTMVPRSTKILTRAAMKNSAIAAVNEHIKLETVTDNATKKIASRGPLHVAETVVKRESLVTVAKPTTRRISNEFQSDDSMYMSALEDISENDNSGPPASLSSSSSVPKTKVQQKPKLNEANRIQSPELSLHVVPSNVHDFDKENWDDPFQVSHYALDIFRYLKEREDYFLIGDYMGRQTSLTKWMRSLLVDWMVEVQESFELNHETLYLAVKIVDLYLSKETISKDSLQLLGAAALFLSSKYEENNPPLTEDFLYICDGAYSDTQLIRMEKIVFRTINFNLGIPLSYRFLRRYARAGKIPMPVLTLARYILELSLMDYATIQFRDSKSAAAALFIALRMHDETGWNETLKFYSGYKIEDFANIVLALNVIVARKPKDPINTIRKKYSHTVFLAVAKIPLKTNAELFNDYNHLITAATGGKSSESNK